MFKKKTKVNTKIKRRRKKLLWYFVLKPQYDTSCFGEIELPVLSSVIIYAIKRQGKNTCLGFLQIHPNPVNLYLRDKRMSGTVHILEGTKTSEGVLKYILHSIA